jgi:hypothetical protein
LDLPVPGPCGSRRPPLRPAGCIAADRLGDFCHAPLRMTLGRKPSGIWDTRLSQLVPARARCILSPSSAAIPVVGRLAEKPTSTPSSFAPLFSPGIPISTNCSGLGEFPPASPGSSHRLDQQGGRAKNCAEVAKLIKTPPSKGGIWPPPYSLKNFAARDHRCPIP